jgi:flagellar biosynthesis/type III secretory pathway protein FliH
MRAPKTIAEYFYMEGFKEGFEKRFKEEFNESFMKDMKKGRKKGRKRGLDDDQIAMLCSLVFQTQTFAVEYEACLQAAISESIEHDLERVLTKIRSSLEDRAGRDGALGAGRAGATILDACR